MTFSSPPNTGYPRAGALKPLRKAAAAKGSFVRRAQDRSSKRLVSWRVVVVKNPLDSLLGTVLSGFILTVLLYFLAHALVVRAGA
jgi:hypothetical protein